MCRQAIDLDLFAHPNAYLVDGSTEEASTESSSATAPCSSVADVGDPLFLNRISQMAVTNDDEQRHEDTSISVRWYYEARSGVINSLYYWLDAVATLVRGKHSSNRAKPIQKNLIYILAWRNLARNRPITTNRCAIIAEIIAQGWWEYDERTGKEIEDSYTKLAMNNDGEASHRSRMTMLIAGHVYCIDFDEMCQYRADEVAAMSRRSRRIKRVVATDRSKDGVGTSKVVESHVDDDLLVKGVAGIVDCQQGRMRRRGRHDGDSGNSNTMSL